MTPETRILLVELRDLLAFLRERANKHGLSEVSITIPRATALLNQLNAVLKPQQKRQKKNPAWAE
jgi:hypothetical protein